MNKKELKRQTQKTSEGEFIHELRSQYELSPKLSEQILLSAKQHLLREYVLKEGQIEVIVIGIEERSGKMIEQMLRKKVILTIDNGIEDKKALEEFGRIGLRQIRIQRITEEAIEQDGILTQEDLSRYLVCDTRTIKRDIQEIKKRGIEVITRGVLHNIGRGQTHKDKIIELHLDGKTYSEIKLKTHHTTGAIKRYIESFTKILVAIKYGIEREKEIAIVSGLSDGLTRDYLKLINRYKREELKAEKMREMVRNWTREEAIKKTMETTGKTAVRMMGGCV